MFIKRFGGYFWTGALLDMSICVSCLSVSRKHNMLLGHGVALGNLPQRGGFSLSSPAGQRKTCFIGTSAAEGDLLCFSFLDQR